MSKPKILIVDDEKPTRDVMARILAPAYDCRTAPDAEQALQILTDEPDLALLLTDYKMPGMNGVELIKAAKAAHPALAAILITAFGEIELAVEAMKEGADDFLTKPVTDLAQMEMRVSKALAKNVLFRKLEETPPEAEPSPFIGASSALKKLTSLIRKVAPTEATVLIEGPSGSGKELTARAIHTLSKRKGGPFVAVECASLPSTLLEAELFGAVKGAFTGATDRAGCFESADGGTLFLDEIGEIDANVQVKLLRVLESRTFQRLGEPKDRTSDFRLVTATNKSLAKLVYEGKFREDLYYRLNVIDLHTPALAEHKEDIAPLVKRFIKEFSEKNGGRVTSISPEALARLENEPWPGNVRQLRNTVEKMVILASGETLTVDDVPASAPPPGAPAPTTSLADTERANILATLKACNNNKSQAALKLGISRRTLHRKLKEWSLT